MVDAVDRQTAPYRRTYEIDGWLAFRDTAGDVHWSLQRDRFVHTFQPPDALEQDYEDLTAAAEPGIRTLTVGSAVYTRTKAGWVCARAPTELRIVADQIVSRKLLEPLRSTSAPVAMDVTCGAHGCDRVVAEFRDDLSVVPSTVRLELVVDRSSFLPASYSSVRVYDGGKQLRTDARFAFSLTDHLSPPAAPCPSSSG